jgi:hypothetical protein
MLGSEGTIIKQRYSVFVNDFSDATVCTGQGLAVARDEITMFRGRLARAGVSERLAARSA